MTAKAEGLSHLFSFPFWLMVDTHDPPKISEINFSQQKARIYPPFRSGPANFLGMPPIRAQSIPFLSGAKPNMPPNLTLLTPAAIPQFKNETGKASLLLAWGESWEAPPRFLPMDSMRIDIIGDYEKANAAEILLPLLSQLRSLSGQWWINRSIDRTMGLLRNQFKILADGSPIELPIGAVNGRSPSGFEKAITQDIWRMAITNMEANSLPPTYELLLLDAWYDLTGSDFRQLCINAAAACEQAIDINFSRLWETTNPGEKYKKSKITSAPYDIGRHIGPDIKRLVGQSFQDHNPEHYTKITQLWDARGNAAHGKKAFYISDGNPVTVNAETADRFLVAARRLIDWLGGLT